MREADNKSALRFSIGATIIILVIAMLCYTSIIPNYLYSFFTKTTSWTKYLGLVSFAVALWMVYGAHNATVNEKSGAFYWIMVLLFIALGIGLANGFNWDFFRLK